MDLDPAPEVIVSSQAMALDEPPAAVVAPPIYKEEARTIPASKPVARVIHKRPKVLAKAKVALPQDVPAATTTLSTQISPKPKEHEIIVESKPEVAPAPAPPPVAQYAFPAIPDTPPAQKIITAETGATIQVRVEPSEVTAPIILPTTQTVVTTQTVQGPQPQFGPPLAKNDYSKPTHPTTTHSTDSRALSVGPPAEAGPAPPPGFTGSPALRAPTFVEAFDETTAIPTASSDALTIENPEGVNTTDPQVGWRIATATSHLPSLYWASSQSTPILSKNAALFLSKMGGNPVSIQAGTGIVFGKVPSGWTVELSGRAERPVVLDQTKQPVSTQSTEGDRSFAFFNSEPGAHLIYLIGPLGKSNGAVAVPVLSETATYVDLSIVTKKSVTGRVLDAGSASAQSIRGAEVRVIGQPGTVAVTDSQGQFSISNVSVISNYPLYLETDAASGYTHRYKVASGHERDLTLFRLGNDQLTEWLGQLEGGVSSTSGVIVAAVPRPIAANSEYTVYPSTESLASAATLKPETYALSSEGQLQINVPLKPESPRFISVQVPEGPAIVRLEDQRQAMVWSELVISQPGIVNVIGAY
jgi:hypothetical protein